MSIVDPETPPLPPKSKRGKPKGTPYQQHIIYEYVFTALKNLSNKSIPQTINRISTSPQVKLFLVKNELIKEVKPEDNLKQEYLTYKYYTIESKGQEYIKRYESFKELLT